MKRMLSVHPGAFLAASFSLGRESCAVLADVALPPSPAALRASTSPVEGEVMCRLPPPHLSPGGRGRARSARVRGEPPRCITRASTALTRRGSRVHDRPLGIPPGSSKFKCKVPIQPA